MSFAEEKGTKPASRLHGVPDGPTAVLRYFDYVDEPLIRKMNQQGVARQFRTLAWWLEDSLPDGPEKSVALRKLLEAKDAAVRSALDL